MKHSVQLEAISKGFANHHRISILVLLKQQPKLSLIEITEKLRLNVKTASVHVKRLHQAGLVNKRYMANEVQHTLTDRGKDILKFLRKLE